MEKDPPNLREPRIRAYLVHEPQSDTWKVEVKTFCGPDGKTSTANLQDESCARVSAETVRRLLKDKMVAVAHAARPTIHVVTAQGREYVAKRTRMKKMKAPADPAGAATGATPPA